MDTREKTGGERATLQAVAARAGVSTSTVSLVLAGKASVRGISESTHQKVHQAAEELNYAPNLLTRSLRKGRMNVLSFYSAYRNRDRNDLYMEKLASGIETAGGVVGYDVLVHCNFNRSPKEIYQFLNGGLADGLLFLAPLANDPLLALLRKSALPVVIVNGEDALGQYASVADDVVQGMRHVADEIAAQGHRNVVALVADNRESRDADRRVALLRRFLAEHGVDLPAHRVVPAGDASVENVLAELRRRPEPPTAVFCWHDRLAYALLSACEAQGVLVPEELSVVGYDGLHWPSRTSHEVASAHVDLDSLALTAVRLLDESILEPGRSVVHRVQPVSFLRGTSLGAAPSATEQIT